MHALPSVTHSVSLSSLLPNDLLCLHCLCEIPGDWSRLADLWCHCLIYLSIWENCFWLCDKSVADSNWQCWIVRNKIQPLTCCPMRSMEFHTFQDYLGKRLTLLRCATIYISNWLLWLSHSVPWEHHHSKLLNNLWELCYCIFHLMELIRYHTI